jgi:hypothetical protein
MTNFADRTIWIRYKLDVLHGVNSGSIALIYLDSPLSLNCGYGICLGLEILFRMGLSLELHGV